MANEEQRRAFASYMGTADTSAGQQTAQYPGTYANSGNPYLYPQQQFPGVSGLPAAPTPPPAASSSIASYPSYTSGLQGGFQGGLQGAYSQGGLQQGGFQQGYQQNGIPRRPPPLGEGEGFPREQQTQQRVGQQAGHAQFARGYDSQPPPPQGFNIGYQYSDPRAQQDGRTYRETNARAAMVPSRNFSGDIVESRSRHVSYHHHESAPPADAPPPTDTVPVLLCHTCSHCGQMRSAGYHRNNPVIPGKPLVLTPCRKCKKKVKNQQHSMSSFTRVRSCTAEEPCDWPGEDVRIDVEQYDRRGRQRSRDTVFVHRSSSRPNVIRQSSSQTRFGLRGLQRESRMQDVLKSTRIRVSSLSPRRASRYEELNPHPDVMRSARSQEMPPPPTNANQRDADEVWPPPDGVRAHLFRKVEMDPPRRQSSRIVELTPSPPPEGRRTRFVYRSESVERRHRSVSRGRLRDLEDQRAAEAEARVRSHPRAYRTVHPEERNFRQTSDETYTSDDLYLNRHGRRESPGGILKAQVYDCEQSRRREGIRNSDQSTTVEIGGPRVHFSSGRRTEEQAPYGRDRPRYVDDVRPRDEEFELNFSQRRYAEDPTPPVEEMERERIRRRSQSPRAQYEEEIRIDRARRISPSPSRNVEHVRVRHVSPAPPRERAPRSPPMEDRRAVSGFRHVSREEVVSRTQSVTPPRARRPVEDDMTDSDSAHSGEIVEVRTWKGIDENGKPATFVEERRRVRTIEQGSERGGQAEFRPLNERAPMRSCRDV